MKSDAVGLQAVHMNYIIFDPVSRFEHAYEWIVYKIAYFNVLISKDPLPLINVINWGKKKNLKKCGTQPFDNKQNFHSL